MFCGRECVQVTNIHGCQECACSFPQSSSHSNLPIQGQNNVLPAAKEIFPSQPLPNTLESFISKPSPAPPGPVHCPVVQCTGDCITVTNPLGCQECACTFPQSASRVVLPLSESTSSTTQQTTVTTTQPETTHTSSTTITTTTTVPTTTTTAALPVTNKPTPDLVFTAEPGTFPKLANGTNCPFIKCGKDCIQVTNPLGCQECACTFRQNASLIALPVSISSTPDSTTTKTKQETKTALKAKIPTTAPEPVTKLKIQSTTPETEYEEVVEDYSDSTDTAFQHEGAPEHVTKYTALPAQFANPFTEPHPVARHNEQTAQTAQSVAVSQTAESEHYCQAANIKCIIVLLKFAARFVFFKGCFAKFR